MPVTDALATHCGGGDLADNDAIVVDVGRNPAFGVKGDLFVNDFPSPQWLSIRSLVLNPPALGEYMELGWH